MEDTRNAILSGNNKFMAAIKQGDAAKIFSLYTKDAKLLPPNSQMISGAKAIQDFWQGAMKLGIQDAKLETLEIEERGDLAVEVGSYMLTVQPAGSNSTTNIGKYVVVWKNDNGTWKLHLDIWNTNAPA